MANSKKPKRTKIPFGDVKWVLNNLTDTELEEYDAAIDSAELTVHDLNGWVHKMIEEGWSMSSKWDDYSECVQVSFVAGYKDMENAGFAFSARSDDWVDAVGLCYWKFVRVGGGVLSAFSVTSESVRG